MKRRVKYLILLNLYFSTPILKGADDAKVNIEALALFSLVSASSILAPNINAGVAFPFLSSIDVRSEIDILRGVEAETPVLDRVSHILKQFKSQYRSSQSYHASKESLAQTISQISETMPEWVSRSQIREIKSLLSRLLNKEDLGAATAITMRIPEFKGKTIDVKAIYYNFLDFVASGECGVQSYAMIIELMKLSAEAIYLYVVVEENDNHAFVVFKHDGLLYAVDPFFDILCPLDEYWNHEKFLDYFRYSLSNPQWKPDYKNISLFDPNKSNGVMIKSRFLLHEYKPLLELILEQIKFTSQYFSSEKNMIQIKEKYNRIRNAEEPYQLIHELKEFIKIICNRDKELIKNYLKNHNIIIDALKTKTESIDPNLRWQWNLNGNMAWILSPISDRSSLEKIKDLFKEAGIEASIQKTKDRKHWCLMLTHIFYE